MIAAFAPPNDDVDVFEELSDVIINTYNADADGILDYIEDSNIGRYRRTAPRIPPLFAIEMWNMFHRTHLEMQRTNNHIEGWHHRSQSLCAAWHPTFWTFIDMLNSQSINRAEILQTEGVNPPPTQRCRYVDCNARILTMIIQIGTTYFSYVALRTIWRSN